MPLSRDEIARLTEIVGRANATTDPLDLRAYEYDAALERARPDIVLFPTSTEMVAKTVRFCNERGIPVTPRGSGTSLSGGPVPLRGGVVLEFSRMDRLLEIDLKNQRAVVQPGYLNFDFVEELARYGHFYAPDPASQRVCTMGGNVAENSGGPHCLKYGVTTNHVTGVKVVLPDGEVMELGGKTIETPPYDLRGVIIGSEGTLAIVTEIICRIIPLPEKIVTMLAIFDSLIKAGEAVSGIIASGMIPATLEMMDRAIIRAVEEAVHAGYPLDAEAVLIIELDGMAGGMDEQIRQVTEVCKRHGALRFEVAKDEAQRELLWRGRKGAFGAVARIAPNKIVTDIAVPRTVLPRVLAEVKEIGRRHGLEVGNVFHAGDGNLHPQLLFDDRYPEQLERVQAADKEIAKLAVAYGGVLSGEHGIGCQKRYAMPLMYAPQDLAAMRAMKAIFDPRGILNPDKILPEPTQEEVTLEPQRLKRALPNEGEFQVESYEEAAAALAEATMRGEVVTPVGGRTKIGNPEGLLLLSARPLRGLVDYDWENLTVTIQAGATVAELQQLLAEHGQFCPLSAPFAEAATIGGVVAANSNGPLRYGYGELRDVVLGVKWAAGTGQVYTSGSKTVKNVTGYDLKRLLVGSCGSLGLIVEVTFRTLPLPPTEETLVIRVREFARVCAIAEEVRTSHLLPCAIEAVNGPLWALVSQTLGHSDASPEGWRLLFSLRGYKADVNEMRDGITDIAGRQGEEEVAVWGHEVSAELWRSVAEAVRLVNSSYYALRVIVPSGRLQKPVSAALSCEGLPLVRVSMGTGNIHVIADANSPSPEAWAAYAQILRAAAEAEGGWLTVDAPSGGAEAFVPRRKPDRISEAIKAYFDPGVILPRIPS